MFYLTVLYYTQSDDYTFSNLTVTNQNTVLTSLVWTYTLKDDEINKLQTLTTSEMVKIVH